jgi:hypothetical protein
MVLPVVITWSGPWSMQAAMPGHNLVDSVADFIQISA